MNIQAALNPKQASNYIGIDTQTDALKTSRSTGVLWGVEAPKFIKTGARKVIYLKADLDDFLNQFDRYTNNAQVQDIEVKA